MRGDGHVALGLAKRSLGAEVTRARPPGRMRPEVGRLLELPYGKARVGARGAFALREGRRCAVGVGASSGQARLYLGKRTAGRRNIQLEEHGPVANVLALGRTNGHDPPRGWRGHGHQHPGGRRQALLDAGG